MRIVTSGTVLAAALALSACTTSETLHHEGVTSYAGDAIAANTMLQMVDPWQHGVQHTDLETPAERPWRQEPAADSGASYGGKPATNP